MCATFVFFVSNIVFGYWPLSKPCLFLWKKGLKRSKEIFASGCLKMDKVPGNGGFHTLDLFKKNVFSFRGLHPWPQQNALPCLFLWNVCLLVGCLTSQQQASVSQGRICSDNFTSCHTEIEVADPTFYFTQSQYTDTGPTSPSADPITPGAWQGSHWSANFEVTGMTRPQKIPAQAGFEPGTFRSRGGRLNHKASEAVVPLEENLIIQ